MRYKAILWDSDGVLVDTEPVYIEACEEIFKKIGTHYSARELYLNLAMIEGSSMWKPVKKELCFTDDQIQALRKERDRVYTKLLKEKTKIISGIPAVMRKLHGKVAMAVVTGALPVHFKTIHQHTGLLKYFDFVIYQKKGIRTKPFPDPYLQALKKGKWKASECLAIEDSPKGIRSAHSAGIDCFAVPTRLTAYMKFPGATKILKSIRELPDLII